MNELLASFQELWVWTKTNPGLAGAVFAGAALLLGLLQMTFGIFRPVLALFRRKPATDPMETLNRLLAAHEEIGELKQDKKQLENALQALEARAEAGEEPDRIAEAFARLDQNDTSAAEAIFREVLEAKEAEGAAANRQAAEAARHLGALAFLHDTQAALVAYEKAIALDPDNTDGWTQLGHLRRRLGRLELAEQAYETVLRLGNRDASDELIAIAKGNLGVIYRTRGELDRAAETHGQALALHEALCRKGGMAIQYANLGALAEERGDPKTACRHWAKALALYEEVGIPDKIDLIRGWMAEAGCGDEAEAE